MFLAQTVSSLQTYKIRLYRVHLTTDSSQIIKMDSAYNELKYYHGHEWLWKVNRFIKKLDISPLMCAADKVWITELTLIHKNIRSVLKSHVQDPTLILKIISQCDVKQIMTSPIKTITSFMKASTYIITNISDNVCLDLPNRHYSIFTINPLLPCSCCFNRHIRQWYLIFMTN